MSGPEETITISVGRVKGTCISLSHGFSSKAFGQNAEIRIANSEHFRYLCYPIMSSITKFLRKNKVREAFGVDKRAPDFVGCSNEVGREFQKANDFIIDTRPFVATLLHSGIRVLIYVGTYDWICNFVGNERVFGSLDWKGLPDFRYQQENNKQVWSGGLWWESGPLRYARVNGAGHMVPWDKPVEAL
jgi:carboxypeptidase C (cathepsin A)